MTMKLASAVEEFLDDHPRPASPSLLSESIMSTAACASARLVATTTPLPAASPSA